MKLYFYILGSDREFNPETRTFGDYAFKVRVEECEVIEKPVTYKAATKFPDGIYIGYVKKKDIGRIFDSLTPYIVLEEPNYQFVKNKFLEKYNKEISRLKNAIAMYENKIAAIEDYKEDTKC
jgi:hypothetical protein|nr:MAG TPA: hypothetical protein [Caudoviricetes sp.]